MQTLDDPQQSAAEASAALRRLAHATRTMSTPAAASPVIGDLLVTVRSLRDVLDQLVSVYADNRALARGISGAQTTGPVNALAAADELHQAGTLLDTVEWCLDSAAQHSSHIAWPPAAPSASPIRTPAVSRWISVVFLEGSDADSVLDLIADDGADVAIKHLTGYDYGEETTQAALENGYVYDTPPAGTLDRIATSDGYALTYSPVLGRVALLREYDSPPDPALVSVHAPRRAARASSPEREPTPRRRTGAQTDWFARGQASATHGRGLVL